jgi:hypothetical protein
VKYKNIKSMLHNFGHSFVSLMNYVDGEYAIDLLATALKELPEDRLEVHFPSRRIEPPAEYSPKLRKSVAFWADSLPRHMASHGVTQDALPELVLVIFGDARGMHSRVQATDDRGKKYDVLVNEAA